MIYTIPSPLTFLLLLIYHSVVFGPWYDHVNGWWKKKQTHSNIHYMFYEDMIEVICFNLSQISPYFTPKWWWSTDDFWSCLQDTGREIEKLCSFIGLSPSAEEKEMIKTGVQFDNMKKNKMTNYSTLPVMDFQVSPFMRKGLMSMFMLQEMSKSTSKHQCSQLMPVFLQEKLVTGRITSLWHRMKSLMKTTRERWRTLPCISAVNSEENRWQTRLQWKKGLLLSKRNSTITWKCKGKMDITILY